MFKILPKRTQLMALNSATITYGEYFVGQNPCGFDSSCVRWPIPFRGRDYFLILRPGAPQLAVGSLRFWGAEPALWRLIRRVAHPSGVGTISCGADVHIGPEIILMITLFPRPHQQRAGGIGDSVNLGGITVFVNDIFVGDKMHIQKAVGAVPGSHEIQLGQTLRPAVEPD